MAEGVIAFAKPYKDPPENIPWKSPGSLGETLEVALQIHDCIIEGLHSGRLDDGKSDPAMALADALIRTYGMDYVLAAHEHFEHVYGCDPYTFLEHVSGFRSEQPAAENIAI